MPLGQRNVRRESVLDELRIGVPPRETDEHADVPALHEPEPPGPSCDLGELPREEVAALLAVELRRLGEEERLAGKVDAVAEDVGRDAHVRPAVEEAVDLLAPRRERHRAVQHRDPAGMQPVDLAGEREDGLAAERDDDRSRR